jgi:hypothetical protein
MRFFHGFFQVLPRRCDRRRVERHGGFGAIPADLWIFVWNPRWLFRGDRGLALFPEADALPRLPTL